MAERVFGNIYCLDIPLVGNPLKNLNSYLILDGERSLLIDTGFRQQPCLDAMEAQLSELGVDRDKMDIFVTHLHSDHAGLAPTLIRDGCKIYIGSIDAKGLWESQNPDYWRVRYAMFKDNGFSQYELDHLWDHNPAKIAAPEHWDGAYTCLDDGDRITYGGHELRCILTPGHTPGHMCLYSETEQILFSGDNVLFHITPNIARWMELEDALGDYIDSLGKIRDLPCKLLLPAHRHRNGSLSGRIDELIFHHARRLEGVRRIVRTEPGLNAYEIAARMKWSIRSKSWDDFPLAQKYFAVGEALSHLDYLAVRGVVEAKREGEYFRYYIV